MELSLPPKDLDRRQLAWRAELALVEVLAAELNARTLARLSFWLCRAAAFGYFGVILWSALTATNATLVLVRQGAQVISWLAGIGALAVAGPEPMKTVGERLLRLRGISSVQSGNAEWAAASAVVFKAVAPPSLVLALLPLPLCTHWSLVPRTALAALGVGVYTVAFSVILGVSAHFAKELSPRRGRSLLLSVYVLPLLLQQVLPIVSIPGALSGLLRVCLGLGIR